MAWFAAVVVAHAAAAERVCCQDASTRRIDSTPKIVLGPDTKTPAATTVRTGVPDDVVPAPGSGRDRALDLELDLKENREARERGSGGMADWVAAVAVVVGSALVIGIVLVIGAKRRER
jgi:hypothetical protein